ncbi:TPA: hypothetical protein EYN65_11080 [Candidatus Poribacteria bacterium]|nr:hypothetical protein [Candidatus Poribacteria bacterium]HIB98411.1 hypothetical protein [Candidatus Poribacteria bacterium]HIN31320.1 hypothetical protein [Candidatus Poribacteria bacterium]HIO47585.1 hypothetical protein [Candidatus Poribacteria bacterium]HIO79956.1 hypothetical protein [Candidatus Poribacteria bacterium]
MSASKPRLIAEVFEHLNFGGRRGYVIKPISFTADIGFQDNISSIKVYKGPGFTASPNQKMILYEHWNFQGQKLILGPGFYPNIHDMIYNFKDTISSISFGSLLKTSGPEWGTVPLIVECYEHAEFSGRNITVLRDVPHTGALGLHDSISSVRIIKGPDFPPQGAEVTFFEHVDFEGSKLTIRMDAKDHKKEIPNFHYLPQQFNDVVSSIKIEGWSTSAEFTEMVFEDEFIGNRMRPEWRWEDPEGGGHWAERQGYLEMRAEPGQDLWHGDPNQPVPRDHNLPPDAVVLRAAGAIQMESGVTIIDKDGATGRKAIDSQRGARAFHNVYLRRPGRWYIWIRGYFPEPSKDSYWIGIDNADPHPWDREGGTGAIKIFAEVGDSTKQGDAVWGTWYWDCGVKSASVPQSYFEIKSPGTYRLWSKGRESGSILDQILLTQDPNFNPESVYRGANISMHSAIGSGGNLDAPRLLLPVAGDFTAECRIRLSVDMKEHGGLIVWKNPQAFVRLEKTSGSHAFRGDIRFERHVDGVFSLVGRGQGVNQRMSQLGPIPVRFTELYLRLERKGHQFSGYVSDDGVRWVGCGHTNVAMGDPVEVGLHALCPGNIPPTLTRFEYFRVFKRQGELLEQRLLSGNVQALTDQDFKKRQQMERNRAIRDLY